MDGNSLFAVLGVCGVAAYLGKAFIEARSMLLDTEMEERMLLAGYQRDYVSIDDSTEASLEWVFKGKPTVTVEKHFSPSASGDYTIAASLAKRT